VFNKAADQLVDNQTSRWQSQCDTTTMSTEHTAAAAAAAPEAATTG